MRICPALLLALGLTLYLGNPARSEDAAAAIVDTAIKAQGGAANLAKTALMVRKSKGTINIFGMPDAFTDEWLFHFPDRWRSTIEGGPAGQKFKIIGIVDGDKGWQSINGVVTELPKQRVDELKEEGYMLWVSTLVPLQKESGFELKPLKEKRIGDSPAAGVKVSRKGHGDLGLYFDKESGLLVRVERRAREAGVLLDKDYSFSEYKPFEGVRLPTRYLERLNGKNFVEASEISYEFVDRFDEAKFAKP